MKPIYKFYFLVISLFTVIIFPLSPFVYANADQIGVVYKRAGEVYIERGDSKVKIGEHQILLNRDVLATQNKGKAEVHLSMGNKLTIQPASQISIHRTFEKSFQYSYKVDVKGTLITDIKSGQTGTFQFLTPHTYIHGNDAKFKVTVDKDGTQLHLIEGKIDLITQKSNFDIQLNGKVPIGRETQSALHSEMITVKIDEEVLPPVPVDPPPVPIDQAEDTDLKLKTVSNTEPILKSETIFSTLSLNQKGKPQAPEETVSKQLTDRDIKEEEDSIFLEHSVALGSFVLSYWMGVEEVSKYNDLSDENDSLKRQYDASTDADERATLMSDYNVNKEKMSTHQDNITLYNQIALIAAIAEGYFLFRDFWGSGWFGLAQKTEPEQENLKIRSFMDYSTSSVGVAFNWKW